MFNLINNIGLQCSISVLLLLLTAGCGGGSSNSSTNVPSAINNTTTQVSEIALPDVITNTLNNEISAVDAVKAMAIGINLGNTLDAPTEGDWALAAEEQFIEDFKTAGFKHIRIPVTWNNHAAINSPFTIDSQFLDRVEQVVDWALNRDLYVILNVHHDSWIKENYDDIEQRNRFYSIWIQIAEHFKNKSARLMFEILNEPNGLTLEQLNRLNKRTLEIIRNQTSNRLVVFAGNDYSNIDTLLATDVPNVDDQFLIGNFHSYDPWQFAGECVQSWGNNDDKQQLLNIYQKAFNWSVTNNIPVMVNEFGVAKFDFNKPENICEQSQRDDYINAHVSYAASLGIAATFWDDGGSFSTYDRANNSWGPEKNILIQGYNTGEINE